MTHEALNEVKIELLLGHAVHDVTGAKIGRVAEIVAKKDGDEFVIEHYLVGPHAWFHRFAVHGLGLRLRGVAWQYRVEWDQMDLSDPHRPRVTCCRDELPLEHLPPRLDFR